MQQGDAVPSSLDILYTETRELFIRQLADIDALDTKSGLIAGFAGLILTSLLGTLEEVRSVLGHTGNAWHSRALVGLIFFGSLSVLLSFVLAVMALWVRRYKDLLAPEAAYDRLVNLQAEATKHTFVRQWAGGYEQNRQAILHKAAFLTWSLRALLLGLALFFGIIALYLSESL